jgi:predicted transcriptional regulator
VSSDKDDFFDSIADLYLLLNGRTLQGKKATYGSYFTTLRYALVLSYAITSQIVRDENEKDFIPNCTRFNFYRLNKVANLLKLEFERRRIAKKIYAELKDRGYAKTERKGGKEYICLTEKGKMSCRNKLEETRKLKRYFMSLPLLQVKYNEEKVPAGMVVKGAQPATNSHAERLVEQTFKKISDW